MDMHALIGGGLCHILLHLMLGGYSRDAKFQSGCFMFVNVFKEVLNVIEANSIVKST